MCDMRPVPDVLVNLQTNEAIINPYKGQLTMTTFKDFGRYYKDTEGLEPGLYMLNGTGAHYSYWDGERYHSVYGDSYKMYWDKEGCCGHNIVQHKPVYHYTGIEEMERDTGFKSREITIGVKYVFDKKDSFTEDCTFIDQSTYWSADKNKPHPKYTDDYTGEVPTINWTGGPKL